MKIVLYASGKNEAATHRLLGVIESKISHKSLEIFHSIRDFSERTTRLPREIDVAVLFAQNHSQLSEMIALKDFLEDAPILLILPDRKKGTLSKGLELSPKFIDYADNDFSNVGAVLKKIITNYRQRKKTDW